MKLHKEEVIIMKIKSKCEMMTMEALNRICYGNSDNPREVLGCHRVKEGWSICAYHPFAVKLYVENQVEQKKYKMNKEVGGFFWVIIPNKEEIPKFVYRLIAEEEKEGISYFDSYEDPYSFYLEKKEKDYFYFHKGLKSNAYQMFGAHICKKDGIEGTEFTVYAPNAKRVSVLGEWNHFHPYMHMMQRLEGGGIFSLFLPQAKEGMSYYFEIKTPTGEEIRRADPYRVGQHKQNKMLGVIQRESSFSWSDQTFQEERDKRNECEIFYEVEPAFYRKMRRNHIKPYPYKQLAKELVQHVKTMGYTAVLLDSLLEHENEKTIGGDVVAYFAPASQYGTRHDLQSLINELHCHNIAVYMKWDIATYSLAPNGLAFFDGSATYEYENPLLGRNVEETGGKFDYQKGEVRSFLYSSCAYWIQQFHIDGFLIDEVASMLYQDYGRIGGEWIKNQYGEKENMEALEFLRTLQTMMKKEQPYIRFLVQDNSGWNGMTKQEAIGGLGFDAVLSNRWLTSYMNYMKQYPTYRFYDFWNMQQQLMLQMRERCLLTSMVDSERRVTMIQQMPGQYFQRFAHLRVLYGYYFGILGDKMLFMGEDFANWYPLDIKKGLDTTVMKQDIHAGFQQYMKDLIAYYKGQAILHEQEEESFAWFHTKESEYGIFSFIRKGRTESEQLLFVFHLRSEVARGYLLTVPEHGEYQVVFHSDKMEYGGLGNSEYGMIKQQRTDESQEDVPYLIVDLPPISFTIFSYNVLDNTKNLRYNETENRRNKRR